MKWKISTAVFAVLFVSFAYFDFESTKVADETMELNRSLYDRLLRAGNQITQLKIELIELKDKCSKPEPAIYKIPVLVTSYSPTRRECDDTPHITAFNSHVRKGTIAVSRDLLYRAKLRKWEYVYLVGVGPVQVNDKMNARKNMQVDLFNYSTEAANRFGNRETMLIINKKWKSREDVVKWIRANRHVRG